MTKYVSPDELVGTELKGTEYKRLYDNATMHDYGRGSFEAVPGTFEADKNPVRSKQNHRPP